MANAKGGDPRPLSPHLMIYKQSISMVMSIVHRITGGILYVGTLLLAWWLIAVAQGEAYYNFVNGLLGSPFGKAILFGYTWALIHHMLGGLRHLYWDTGRGFNISSVNLMSWATVIGSVVLTTLIWIVGLKLRGAF